MPHDQYNPLSPNFGISGNSGGEEEGGIMSYADKISVQNYEVRFHAKQILEVANSVNSNNVIIHLRGSKSDSPKDQHRVISHHD
jgi:hypothetical protein